MVVLTTIHKIHSGEYWIMGVLLFVICAVLVKHSEFSRIQKLVGGWVWGGGIRELRVGYTIGVLLVISKGKKRQYLNFIVFNFLLITMGEGLYPDREF